MSKFIAPTISHHNHEHHRHDCEWQWYVCSGANLLAFEKG